VFFELIALQENRLFGFLDFVVFGLVHFEIFGLRRLTGTCPVLTGDRSALRRVCTMSYGIMECHDLCMFPTNKIELFLLTMFQSSLFHQDSSLYHHN
jgi:hypothetical protein